MCFLDTYTCSMDCLNAEFPLNTELSLLSLQNLSYQTQAGCKLVCTAVERFDAYAVTPGFVSIDPIAATAFIGAACLFSFAAFLYYRRKK